MRSWRATLAAAVLLLAHTSAGAAEPSPREMREMLAKLAFDPTAFIDSGGDYVAITYRGDDWGWPVYALAIQSDCPTRATYTPGCAARLRAYMVRAPAAPGMTRPRQRGAYLVERLYAREATTPEEIAKVLASEGVEWLEADLSKCPAADKVLQRAGKANWIQGLDRGRGEPNKRGETVEVMILHADTVEVTFKAWLQNSTYSGYIADGSPAQWAVELGQALEPCWRPAASEPPWHRDTK